MEDSFNRRSESKVVVKPKVEDKDLVGLHSHITPEEREAYKDFLYEKKGRLAVPMFLMEAAFKVYDKLNHGQQSLAAIIDRGGFSANEIFHQYLSPTHVAELYRVHTELQQRELNPEVTQIMTDLQGVAGVVKNWERYKKEHPAHTEQAKAELVKALRETIERIEKHL